MTENMNNGIMDVSSVFQLGGTMARMNFKVLNLKMMDTVNGRIVQTNDDVRTLTEGSDSLPILPPPKSSCDNSTGEDVVSSPGFDTRDAKGRFYCQVITEWLQKKIMLKSSGRNLMTILIRCLGESSSSAGDNYGAQPVMPVHMDCEVYNMNHPKRGRAIIFNHENFNSQLELGRRQGTERDKQNLKQTLKSLGFDVTCHDDLKYHDLVHEIEALTKEDHSDRDCLVIAVLSHGDAQLMYAKDYSYKPDMIWQSFTADRVPTLAGKPKLFFIQACQGSQLDGGTKLVRVSHSEVDSGPQSYRIPNHADFLICYSTFPGFYAWRNTTNGSWFVQAVCTVLLKHASSKDLLAMMTIVCREVALHFESNTPSQPHMHQKKQMPFITSTLIRDVYITPK